MGKKIWVTSLLSPLLGADKFYAGAHSLGTIQLILGLGLMLAYIIIIVKFGMESLSHMYDKKWIDDHKDATEFKLWLKILGGVGILYSLFIMTFQVSLVKAAFDNKPPMFYPKSIAWEKPDTGDKIVSIIMLVGGAYGLGNNVRNLFVLNDDMFKK